VSDDVSAGNTKTHAKKPGDFLEGCCDESSFVLSVSVVVGLTAARGVQLQKWEGKGEGGEGISLKQYKTP